MKKIAIVSILLNLILIVLTIAAYQKINDQDKKIIIKEEKKVEKEHIEEVKIDKTDPINIFNSKKFPCDSKYGSYEINLCSGEKLHFADSLLNVMVKANLKKFDSEIKRNQEAVLKVPNDTYFSNSLKSNIALKENFIKTQKKWEELRILNSEYVQIGCEGGTGCSGIVSTEEIKYVLKRIQEIEERY